MKILAFLNKYRKALLLLLIVLTAFSLRTYGNNWDEGGHLHPDERMLIMVADRIQFPSSLNPDFFNYGSLPIYILKGAAQVMDSMSGNTTPLIATYDGMLLLGRMISSTLDIATLFLVYVAAYLLSKKRSIGLLAALCYAISVFPIQNSHYFVVDVFMNLFITAAITSLIWFFHLSSRPTQSVTSSREFTSSIVERRDPFRAFRFGISLEFQKTLALILISLSMGAAFATKFTAIVFFPGIMVSIAYIFLSTHRPRTPMSLSSRAPKGSLGTRREIPFVSLFFKLLFVGLLTLAMYFVCMPYAFLPPSGILTQTSTSSPLPQGFVDILHFTERDYVPQTRVLRDIKEQTRMSNDAYVFPYTLQYVTTKPYIYYLEQIARWGLGYPLSILAIIGIFFAIRNDTPRPKGRGISSVIPCILAFSPGRDPGVTRDLYSAQSAEVLDLKSTNNRLSKQKYSMVHVASFITQDTRFVLCVVCLVIFASTYGLYFIIVGRSAVKFMRYMLPLYPMFAIAAGYGLYRVAKRVQSLHVPPVISNPVSFRASFPVSFRASFPVSFRACREIPLLLISLLISLWTLSFMRIYTKQHTRISATEWILSNIPAGSTLAVEHWDDRVPIRYGERYLYQEMTIYDQPDDKKKWDTLMGKLKQSDYVVLASNRLYTPLPKLSDCKQYRVCFPQATQYYKKLFDGSLGFKKIKEFAAYPGIGPWHIADDDADESFTVYEHPKVILLKNINRD